MPSHNVLVYGSCISRDVFRIVETDFEVVHYIARQSWISAFNASLPHPGDPGLASAFRNRSLIGDFLSNAPQILEEFAPQTDVVLLDITTDRWGVLPVVAGGYLSNTAGLRKSRLLRKIPHGEPIDFFSDEHLSLFSHAAQVMKMQLKELDLFDRTLILAYPFTDTSTDGSPVPVSRGLLAADWNDGFQKYYDLLESIGFRVSMLPRELAVTSADHSWGPAQNHFIDDAYRWWANELRAFR